MTPVEIVDEIEREGEIVTKEVEWDTEMIIRGLMQR